MQRGGQQPMPEALRRAVTAVRPALPPSPAAVAAAAAAAAPKPDPLEGERSRWIWMDLDGSRAVLSSLDLYR